MSVEETSGIEVTPEALAEMSLLGMEVYQELIAFTLQQSQARRDRGPKQQMGVILGQLLAARALIEAHEQMGREFKSGDAHELMRYLIETTEEMVQKFQKKNRDGASSE